MGPAIPAIASPVNVLLVFIGSLAVFHFLLVYLWPLSDRRWKQVDYFWLSVAVLSVVAGADQAQRWFAQLGADNGQARWISAGEAIEAVAVRGLERVCTREFQRLPSSPADLDAVIVEYKAACEWLRAERGRLHLEVFELERPVTLRAAPLKGVPELEGVMRELAILVQRYEGERQKLRKYRAILKDTGTQSVTLGTGPMLLAIALGLRLTKVTGEIRNADRAAASKARVSGETVSHP